MKMGLELDLLMQRGGGGEIGNETFTSAPRSVHKRVQKRRSDQWPPRASQCIESVLGHCHGVSLGHFIRQMAEIVHFSFSFARKACTELHIMFHVCSCIFTRLIPHKRI